MIKTLVLTTLFAALTITGQAQTPSGLTTAAVTYTSLLNDNPYGDKTIWHLADGTECSVIPPSPQPANWSQCYIIRYVSGLPYGNLQASDGTSNGIPNCYTWNTWQFILNDQGYCQTSFHGGGSGETRVALYCEQSTMQASPTDANPFTVSCTAGFDGTAITVENGADVPIPTQFKISVTIQHHPVTVIISGFRQPPAPKTYQQIDSAVVNIAPIPDPPSVSSNVVGGVDDGH